MIPDFDPTIGNLPPGLHVASWAEISCRFGHTDHRRKLLEGLHRALLALKAAGCQRAYVDGSFVTTKQHPGVFDGCWEVDGVDVDQLERLAPTLLEFADRRRAQKAAYGGESFPLVDKRNPRALFSLNFSSVTSTPASPKGSSPSI